MSSATGWSSRGRPLHDQERLMDHASMDGYIAVVAPHLPPSIVTPDALARIRTVARQLPPCSLAGLELRLRDDRPNVDFFVRLPYVNPGLPSSVMASPAWRSVQTVCDAIADPSNPLHRQIRLLFLEFDLDTPPAGVPTPILFLELHTDPPLGACDLAAMAGAAELGGYRATSAARRPAAVRDGVAAGSEVCAHGSDAWTGGQRHSARYRRVPDHGNRAVSSLLLAGAIPRSG